MADARGRHLVITIVRADNTLNLAEVVGAQESKLLTAPIVSGCQDTGTPPGTYRAGKWVKDKTNPVHGPVPWSKDPWGNPYGPYFLPLNNAKTGKYTTYGIHGTRGPLLGNFEKPPVPEAMLRMFIDADDAKYLYCSHGCIRLSNQNVARMHTIMTDSRYITLTTTVVIK